MRLSLWKQTKTTYIFYFVTTQQIEFDIQSYTICKKLHYQQIHEKKTLILLLKYFEGGNYVTNQQKIFLGQTTHALLCLGYDEQKIKRIISEICRSMKSVKKREALIIAEKFKEYIGEGKETCNSSVD